MKGKKLMGELSYINPRLIQEAEFDGSAKYLREKPKASGRRLGLIVLAACLVFALAVTAFATNLFGLRDFLSRYRQQLPEEAFTYIQEESVAAEAEDWSCAITESLSDASTVMATVTIKGGDKYIVIPTYSDPSEPLAAIGLPGEQTIEELAQQQGKKVLMVGARIKKIGDEEVGIGAQDMKNLSESEMVIMTRTESMVTTSATEAVCEVYALEAGSYDVNDVQRIELTFALNRAPAGQTRRYRPVNPDAIPGMTMGDAVITESPLGYSVRIPETITDMDACYNIMKMEFAELEYGTGGSTQRDDGSCYFEASMCQGTLGDTLTLRCYNWDKVFLGAIEFQLLTD